MESNFERIQKERLPTLYEVLIQKTSIPVDLWSFYTYLSQYPYAINYLDFWIDLMAHIRLCKDYLEGIRKSLKEEAPQGQYMSRGHGNDHGEGDDSSDNVSVTTSVLMRTLLEEGHFDFERPNNIYSFAPNSEQDHENDNSTTRQKRYSPRVSQLLKEWKRHSINHDGDVDLDISNTNLSNLMDEYLSSHHRNESNNDATANGADHMNNVPLNRPYITTKQLLNNAKHICKMYLISSERSQRYLSNIPDEIRYRIIELIEKEQHYDPQVFDELKRLTYQFLEIDCFPKFLSRVALHNLHDEISDWRFHKSGKNYKSRYHDDDENNEKYEGRRQDNNNLEMQKNVVNYDTEGYNGAMSPFSNYTSLSRIIIGMIWLGIGFWIGYILIFLNYSRAIRVVTVVPFAIGSYYIVCGLYQVDIIYSWFGVTQRMMYHDKNQESMGDNNSNNNNKHSKVPIVFSILGGRSRLLKIEHVFIRKLLLRRGLWCLLIVAMITAVFTVIFSCVPGHRL